jgi:small-conductance mechanosensitive channel
MANMTFVEQVQNVNTSSWDGFLLSNLFDNSMQEYLYALLIFFGIIIFLRLFKGYIIILLKKFAKRTKTHMDDIIIEVLDAIHWPFYVLVSLYVSLQSINISDFLSRITSKIIFIVLAFYSVIALSRIIDHFSKETIKKKRASEDYKSTSMIRILSTLGKGLLWIIGFLFVLSNFGIEITPIIASLGIGGIAIAFALQNILGDLFSSFTIYFDEPFKEGDFIVIGADKGTVKKVGMKSTRIETLQGEELIVSNTELTTTRINNYKKMEKRRIVFNFGVEYGTPSAKLKKINTIVIKIIDDMPDVDFDRCHFKGFGAFSLDFEVVYFVNMGDYAIYMDKQQDINFQIKEALEKLKVDMAFPTQTIHLKK